MGGVRTPVTAAGKNTQAEPRESFFARFMDALRETRLREARRVIEKHTHLLPSDDS